MVRGRKPIPTTVKKITGQTRPRRMPQNQPIISLSQVVGLPLAPPAYLDDYAADEWRRTWH
jgi:phage terminase small subunit